MSPAEEFELKQKVDKIYDAIVGDSTGNPGIVKRLSEVEAWQRNANTKILFASGFFAGAISLVKWLFKL